MKRRFPAFILCSLLICSVFIPISLGGNVKNIPYQPMSNNHGNTLYVGGEGPDNYTRIQDAIDNATDGDTVFVYDDSSPYYENLLLNKSINLIGEDKNTTIIDAKKYNVILISANEVKIEELTIQNSSWGGKGIEIDREYGFCTISNNNIFNNFDGIIIASSSDNNTIKGNNFFNNEGFTIALIYSNNNTITDNIIHHFPGTYPAIGIALHQCSRNNISENLIKNCDSGISLSHESEYNTIFNNFITSCDYDGIRMTGGSQNRIVGNTISYNCYWGIEIRDNTNDNKIYHNNIDYNFRAVVDEGNNIWDDGKYGNYWSDYKDCCPNAKKLWLKGIWDTPYEIEGRDNKDNCPLINKWPESRPRTFTSDIVSFDFIWIRFLDMFPVLHGILEFIR